MPRTVTVTRYVAPLREGGSLPAIVEADDDGLYVLKFRGAGQGPKALIAELVAGEIGRALGLAVPELVFARLDPALGRSEPDSDIRELIQASGGLNLALDYLPGSIAYDPQVRPRVESGLASDVVWFDAYVTNVDRTARNTNLLVWHRRLWLIDHGAALYMHHQWGDIAQTARSPFRPIRDHVLLRLAGELPAADERARARLDDARLAALVALIPEAWLAGEERFATHAAHRAAYLEYLTRRLGASRAFVEEAVHARAQIL
ncbi:MAG TPA: HipA family kinase [Ktedonobacterales bacterium]|jgi:hypothetical protein